MIKKIGENFFEKNKIRKTSHFYKYVNVYGNVCTIIRLNNLI